MEERAPRRDASIPLRPDANMCLYNYRKRSSRMTVEHSFIYSSYLI